MPGTTSRPRFFSFVVVASIICFCYLIFIDGVDFQRKKEHRNNNQKIVAFSLLKQIEIESEEYFCDEKTFIDGNVEKLNYENQKWRNVFGTEIFVYSVYQDRRLEPYNYLRIIAMIRGFWNSALFCQIQSSNGQYFVTKATFTKIWSESWNQNDTYNYYDPFLISCHIPINTTPASLSFNIKPCQKGVQNFQISTVLENSTKNFTVCVKSLNFQSDISDRLLQWITINKILGADSIYFYIEEISNKTKKLLENFQTNFPNFLKVFYHKKIDSTLNLDEATSIWQKRRYEIITYNDCLYRNIHMSHYIIPIDVDEIIIPRHALTWAELLQNLLPQGEDNFASYTVRNAYYLQKFNVKNLKENIFFFRNIIRSEYSGEKESGKSFISTQNALTIFNHYALKTLKPGVGRIQFLDKGQVQMNHYKNDCDIVILPECAKYLSSPVRIKDDIVCKYKKVFYGEYGQVLKIFNRTLDTRR